MKFPTVIPLWPYNSMLMNLMGDSLTRQDPGTTIWLVGNFRRNIRFTLCDNGNEPTLSPARFYNYFERPREFVIDIGASVPSLRNIKIERYLKFEGRKYCQGWIDSYTRGTFMYEIGGQFHEYSTIQSKVQS